MEIALLVIKTHQLESVVGFYRTIGFIFQEEKHGNGPVHYSCQLNGTVFEIYPLTNSAHPTDSTTRLGFRIDKLDEIMEQLEKAGSTIVSFPKTTDWGYLALVKDPDGRTVELYQK